MHNIYIYACKYVCLCMHMPIGGYRTSPNSEPPKHRNREPPARNLRRQNPLGDGCEAWQFVPQAPSVPLSAFLSGGATRAAWSPSLKGELGMVE